MGHIRLGDPPRSKKWQQVVKELESGADVGAIAAASAEAAESALTNATKDALLGDGLYEH